MEIYDALWSHTVNKYGRNLSGFVKKKEGSHRDQKGCFVPGCEHINFWHFNMGVYGIDSL